MSKHTFEPVSKLGISRQQGKPVTAKCANCGWYTCETGPKYLHDLCAEHSAEHERVIPRAARSK
jgi:tRNA G26 N,N-dimethylase Trm1